MGYFSQHSTNTFSTCIKTVILVTLITSPSESQANTNYTHWGISANTLLILILSQLSIKFLILITLSIELLQTLIKSYCINVHRYFWTSIMKLNLNFQLGIKFYNSEPFPTDTQWKQRILKPCKQIEAFPIHTEYKQHNIPCK